MDTQWLGKSTDTVTSLDSEETAQAAQSEFDDFCQSAQSEIKNANQEFADHRKNLEKMILDDMTGKVLSSWKVDGSVASCFRDMEKEIRIDFFRVSANVAMQARLVPMLSEISVPRYFERTRQEDYPAGLVRLENNAAGKASQMARDALFAGRDKCFQDFLSALDRGTTFGHGERIYPDEVFSSAITCERCGGDGRLACPSCRGEGSWTCHACGGNGRCDSCDGTGRRECRHCRGKGYVDDRFNPDGTSTCPDCRGNGDRRCGACDGSGTCPSCHGRGSGVCQNCQGEGIVKCGICLGRGSIDFLASPLYGVWLETREFFPWPKGEPGNPQKFLLAHMRGAKIAKLERNKDILSISTLTNMEHVVCRMAIGIPGAVIVRWALLGENGQWILDNEDPRAYDAMTLKLMGMIPEELAKVTLFTGNVAKASRRARSIMNSLVQGGPVTTDQELGGKIRKSLARINRIVRFRTFMTRQLPLIALLIGALWLVGKYVPEFLRGHGCSKDTAAFLSIAAQAIILWLSVKPLIRKCREIQENAIDRNGFPIRYCETVEETQRGRERAGFWRMALVILGLILAAACFFGL